MTQRYHHPNRNVERLAHISRQSRPGAHYTVERGGQTYLMEVAYGPDGKRADRREGLVAEISLGRFSRRLEGTGVVTISQARLGEHHDVVRQVKHQRKKKDDHARVPYRQHIHVFADVKEEKPME